MLKKEPDHIRELVRIRYADIVEGGDEPKSCCDSSASCCSPVDPKEISKKLGYSAEDVEAVPKDANLGLGCGNPQAIAALKLGETVLDLGSGAGFDCFLASPQVGADGRVIGVDMTPEMVSKARDNMRAGGYKNVEFRLGEIEHLPVADNCVDAIISNCVINLSPDKQQVVNEAFRVLRPGGRLAVSDILAFAPLPSKVRLNPYLLCGCIAGATPIDEFKEMLQQAGFTKVNIETKPESREFIMNWFPGMGLEEFVVSAVITATK